MTDSPGPDRLDGGWWPQSRDLAAELAELVDELPDGHGRIVRALYSAADWDAAPRSVGTSHGDVAMAARRDGHHQVGLESSTGTVVEVLVVPTGMSTAQGEEALLAAATPGNVATALSLLGVVTELPDVDPADRWTDGGSAWWYPHPTAPSFRTEE